MDNIYLPLEIIIEIAKYELHIWDSLLYCKNFYSFTKTKEGNKLYKKSFRTTVWRDKFGFTYNTLEELFKSNENYIKYNLFYFYIVTEKNTYLNNNLHSFNDKPSIISYAQCYLSWHRNGILHRKDKPSYISANKIRFHNNGNMTKLIEFGDPNFKDYIYESDKSYSLDPINKIYNRLNK